MAPFSISSDDDKQCLNCGSSFEGLRRCGKCKAAYFCNAACQREVWKEHCKTCVAPAGSDPAPTAHGAGAAAAVASAPDAPSAAPPSPASASKDKPTPEQIKQEGMRRIRGEILPEVARLMQQGAFEEATEHLEDGVAFASEHDERELMDSLSCLLARCFLGMDKPKEALMGLNPALMQARREGGAGAVKPHAIAAECRMKLGESDAARVELRALLEAAAESTDEAEQAKALLLAGCALFDLGDWSAAIPVLASAAAAAEKTGDHGSRATARQRAGAALLRARQPVQAIEAWTDELKALDLGEKADADAKEDEKDKAHQKEKGEGETPGGSSVGSLDAKKSAVRAPLGDVRARRCRALTNVFTAHLLAGSRDAAETHLRHALSVAREVGVAEEARVKLRAGHSRRLAGDASNGVSEEARAEYEAAAELARSCGASDIVAAAENGLRGDVSAGDMLAG